MSRLFFSLLLCLALPVSAKTREQSCLDVPSQQPDPETDRNEEASDWVKKDFESVEARFAALEKQWEDFSHKEFLSDADKERVAELGERRRQSRTRIENAFSSNLDPDARWLLVVSHKDLFDNAKSTIDDALGAARKARATEAGEAFEELLLKNPEPSHSFDPDQYEPGRLVFPYLDPATPAGKKQKIYNGLSRMADRFQRPDFEGLPSDATVDAAEAFYIDFSAAETLDDKVAIVYKHFPDLDPDHKKEPEPEKPPRKFGVPKESKAPDSAPQIGPS